MRLLVLSLGAVLACGAALAQTPDKGPTETLWGVGELGIDCYTLPCPQTGIFPVAPDGTRGMPVVWADDVALPPMRGPETEMEALRAAYGTGACLLVEGHFDGPVFAVVRITGTC